MLTLRWEAEASRQFRDTLTYIASHNVAAAEGLDEAIGRKLDLLRQFPESGRPGRVAGSRELVVHPNYVVVYAVKRTTIDIVRFLHVRQLYP